jgi:hypothetical protein
VYTWWDGGHNEPLLGGPWWLYVQEGHRLAPGVTWPAAHGSCTAWIQLTQNTDSNYLPVRWPQRQVMAVLQCRHLSCRHSSLSSELYLHACELIRDQFIVVLWLTSLPRSLHLPWLLQFASSFIHQLVFVVPHIRMFVCSVCMTSGSFIHCFCPDATLME